jgi:ubiquinone/menaquinone biosynthesis C-methylase UbiE
LTNDSDVPQRAELTPHAQRMQQLYRWQALLFDCTRLPVLLGRRLLRDLVPAGARVLEVGCGTGGNLRSLRAAAGPAGDVTGVECAPAMWARARRRSGPGIQVILADYVGDPLPPETQAPDVVVFAYSLSMIPDFREALRRAWDSLRPGGRVVILDFLDTRLALLRRRLRRFGVELGDARRQWLRARGEVLQDRERRAWGGLWRYYLIAVEKAYCTSSST